MASSSSKDPPSGDASYSMVGDEDLEAIGHHCHYTYCNQLDFLPFRCDSCKYTYCLDHRTEDSHECPKKGAWAAAKRSANSTPYSNAPVSQKPTAETGTQCSHPQCKTFINTPLSTGIRCDTCRRSYCLKHRMGEEHDCANLKPLGPVQGPTQTQRASAALSKLRLWGQQKAAAAQTKLNARPAPKPSSTAARLAAANALRRSAKGDAKIPPEKRVYLHVEAEAATTTSKLPKGAFFYNKEWSVGRMLDEAARGLQVENVNNRGGGEETRLRIFHVDKGKLLEFSDKVGASCADGETVVLLRGIGPAIPNLIEA